MAEFRKTPTCWWDLADDDASHYETSCGHAFEFTTDGPRENRFTFCPYCGKRIATEKKVKHGR